MSESNDLLLQKYASEIVQTVMMSVVMKEHPSATTEAVATQLQAMLEKFNAEA